MVTVGAWADDAVIKPRAPACVHLTEEAALLEFIYLAPVGLLRFRPDGGIDMANAAAARLLMPMAPDADMDNIFVLLSRTLPDLRARITRFAPPLGQICEHVRLSLDDQPTVLTLGVNRIGPDTLMAVVQDVTHAVQQESLLRIKQTHLDATFAHVAGHAVFRVGLDGAIDAWNVSLTRIGGWREADIDGATLRLFVPPEQAGQTRITALLDQARVHGTASLEGWHVRRDASRFWASLVATAVPGADGAAIGFVIVMRDLTEQRQMDEALWLAATDPLTAALNRRAGMARLEAAFRHWQSARRHFAVLMLDIDHFKRINDSFGHDHGDHVLVSVVQLCRANLRDGDLVIRWGGEEFLLLLPGAAGAEAAAVAERIRAAIADARIRCACVVTPISASIGVAGPDDADSGVGDAVRRADQALYAAKHGGRNRVEAAKQVLF